MDWKINAIGNAPKSKHEGETIELLNIEELHILQRNDPDTILISIFGDEKLAKDCDDDTRMGYVSCGFLKGYRFND